MTATTPAPSLTTLLTHANHPVPVTQTAPYTTHPDPARFRPASITGTAVGDLVAVSAFGRWRHAVVTKVGRSRLTVAFVTPSNPTERRETAFPVAQVWACR